MPLLKISGQNCSGRCFRNEMMQWGCFLLISEWCLGTRPSFFNMPKSSSAISDILCVLVASVFMFEGVWMGQLMELSQQCRGESRNAQSQQSQAETLWQPSLLLVVCTWPLRYGVRFSRNSILTVDLRSMACKHPNFQILLQSWRSKLDKPCKHESIWWTNWSHRSTGKCVVPSFLLCA